MKNVQHIEHKKMNDMLVENDVQVVNEDVMLDKNENVIKVNFNQNIFFFIILFIIDQNDDDDNEPKSLKKTTNVSAD
jgi:hypothetical protein